MPIDFEKVFKIPRYYLGIRVKVAFKKRVGEKVVGVTNKAGRYFVVTLDYDIADEHIVRADVIALQHEFGLGDAFLFKTGGGFHVLILDLLTWEEWLTVLDAANCDEDFKAVPLTNKRRVWVMRLTAKGENKVTYIGVLKGERANPVSYPHLQMLYRRGIPSKDLEGLNIYSRLHKEELIYATYEA
jgi:hypothetical protein